MVGRQLTALYTNCVGLHIKSCTRTTHPHPPNLTRVGKKPGEKRTAEESKLGSGQPPAAKMTKLTNLGDVLFIIAQCVMDHPSYGLYHIMNYVVDHLMKSTPIPEIESSMVNDFINVVRQANSDSLEIFYNEFETFNFASIFQPCMNTVADMQALCDCLDAVGLFEHVKYLEFQEDDIDTPEKFEALNYFCQLGPNLSVLRIPDNNRKSMLDGIQSCMHLTNLYMNTWSAVGPKLS